MKRTCRFKTFQRVKEAKYGSLNNGNNGEESTSNEKMMYAVFFKSTGLIKAIMLERQKTVTENWKINSTQDKVVLRWYVTIHCAAVILQMVFKSNHLLVDGAKNPTPSEGTRHDDKLEKSLPPFVSLEEWTVFLIKVGDREELANPTGTCSRLNFDTGRPVYGLLFGIFSYEWHSDFVQLRARLP
ncbi:hypothetical protein TNCV_2889621 [Trichonephila clavipes]|nr:hypothetical protein TNCV_2889621 [Trichonephila clavipes]